MVKQSDILNRVKSILENDFPTHPVYINKCPDDFLRPSFLLKLIKVSQVDINRMSIEKTANYMVTCYSSLDEYFIPNAEVLIELQDSVMSLFSNGHIGIGNRAIKIKTITGTMEEDRTNVELQFEYTDNRTDQENILTFMQSVNTKIEEV